MLLKKTILFYNFLFSIVGKDKEMRTKQATVPTVDINSQLSNPINHPGINILYSLSAIQTFILAIYLIHGLLIISVVLGA